MTLQRIAPVRIVARTVVTDAGDTIDVLECGHELLNAHDGTTWLDSDGTKRARCIHCLAKGGH
jgi:hypothetical protein